MWLQKGSNSTMFSLVYVSSATHLFTDQELIDLLKKSRANNQRQDITGLMLYKDGNFIQVLEGPEEAVLATFNKIALDPRHTGLVILSRQQIAERQFPDWAMGFRNANKLQDVAGVSAYLQEPVTPEALTKNPQRTQLLLESFKENLR